MASTSRKQYALKRPLEYDEAIVTSLVRYGEADCIARLFCRERGRLVAFCRGGLKPSARRGGILQAPARAHVGLQIRPNSDLASLMQIDLAAHTLLLSSQLRSFGLASYVAEVVELFIPEHEPAFEVFDLLDTMLKEFSVQNTGPAILRAFELKLLAYCGYLPDLTDVVDCPGKSVMAYDSINGHLLASWQPGLVAFDESARQAALSLLCEPLESVQSHSEPVLRMVAQIFYGRLRQHSKGPLRSVEFLKSVGV
jgi:DNA repair protein RecO